MKTIKTTIACIGGLSFGLAYAYAGYNNLASGAFAILGIAAALAYCVLITI
jgi:hypothetical protein